MLTFVPVPRAILLWVILRISQKHLFQVVEEPVHCGAVAVVAYADKQPANGGEDVCYLSRQTLFSIM